MQRWWMFCANLAQPFCPATSCPGSKASHMALGLLFPTSTKWVHPHKQRCPTKTSSWQNSCSSHLVLLTSSSELVGKRSCAKHLPSCKHSTPPKKQTNGQRGLHRATRWEILWLTNSAWKQTLFLSALLFSGRSWVGASPYPEHWWDAALLPLGVRKGRSEVDGKLVGGCQQKCYPAFFEMSPLFPLFSFSQHPKPDRYLRHHPTFCFEQNLIFFTLPFYWQNQQQKVTLI